MQGRDLPGTVKNPPANHQGRILANARGEGVSGFEVGEGVITFRGCRKRVEKVERVKEAR